MELPEISVVLPAWKEWDNLLTLVPALLAQPRVGEVIVVDDASPGFDPAAWAALLASGRVSLLRNDTRLGLAPSILRGARAARCAYVLIRDSDWNHALAATLPLAMAADGGAELAIASRYRESGPGLTRLNDAFSAALNLFLRALDGRITDWTYGYHLLRRELLEELPLDWIFRGRGEYTVRFYRALLAARPGLRITEIPTRREARGAGRSTTSVLKHGARYLEALLDRVPRAESRLGSAVARWAARGAGTAGSGHSFLGARARRSLFGEAGPVAAPVLDLGCGNGAFTFSVLEKGLEIDGVDAFDAPLALARALPYRRLLRADLAEGAPEFPARGYRTFLCLETAQYLAWPALAGTFRAAREHAPAEGAAFLCLMPNRASYAHRLRRFFGIGAEDYCTHADAALVVAAAAGEGWRLDSIRGVAYGGTRVYGQRAHAPSPWAAHLLFRFSFPVDAGGRPS